MRVGLVFMIAGLLIACGAQPTRSTALAVFDLDQVNSATGEISIGGYGVFARLTDDKDDIVWSSALTGFAKGEPPPSSQVVELEPGEYTVAVNILYASDAIANGHIEYGGTAAKCDARLSATAGSIIAVTVTQIGGESCSVGLAS